MSYRWEAIHAHARDIYYYLNSVEDGFGRGIGQGRAMFDEFGGTLIVRRDGHVVSGTRPILGRLIA